MKKQSGKEDGRGRREMETRRRRNGERECTKKSGKNKELTTILTAWPGTLWCSISLHTTVYIFLASV